MSGAEQQESEPDPIPELLTQQEAVAAPRLDAVGVKDPLESLRYLHRTGQIGYVKVVGRIATSPRCKVVTPPWIDRESQQNVSASRPTVVASELSRNGRVECTDCVLE